MSSNKDHNTIVGFGHEWEQFDQSNLSFVEHKFLFDKYFSIFPWDKLSPDAQGFDMGCGSGRWAKLVAPHVGKIHCIDPSSAIEVAKRNLSSYKNCFFYKAGVDDSVLSDSSMDFGYSLGVLHHVPNTEDGIRMCVRMLKMGAPFLLYLYYALDNRNFFYRTLWKISNLIRLFISKLPYKFRYFVTQFIAVLVYYPLARIALFLDFLKFPKSFLDNFPLSAYRNLSFYTMRTDALDRFGTRLEKRFTREQIAAMMENSGLKEIRFAEDGPYWCAVGFRFK